MSGIVIVSILAGVTVTNAQVRRAESVPGGTRANPLPLSGRQGQSGTVTVVESPNPGGGESVNTINSSVQTQGSFQGSKAEGTATSGSIPLSLEDAVQRGLRNNLGTVAYQQVQRAAHGASVVERSFLLPQISSALQAADQQTDLAALGFGSVKLPIPGASFPTVIGPYHYFDLRVGVSQSLLDLTRLNNYRASQENAKSLQYSAQDARDLVVLAVTGAYLQITASARARGLGSRAARHRAGNVQPEHGPPQRRSRP